MAAYTAIDDPEAYFQVKLYTGTGSEIAVTLGGDTNMQPDFVWTKNREQDDGHQIFDAVRGVTKFLRTNNNDAESTDAQTLKSFDSDGFTVGTYEDMNTSNEGVVAWCWKAGGSTASNTTGDITSTVSVNSTAKFSIVSYTGNGTANQTVGHSLGVTPDLIIIKNRDRAVLWPVINPKFVSVSDTNMLYFASNAAEADDTNIQGTNAHSSTIFGVDDYTGVNVNTEKQIAYCWASVQGFSKFGVYTGNGNADGAFIHLGFRPAFLMVKCLEKVDDWFMVDNKRDPHNVMAGRLQPNSSGAEVTTTNWCDFTANGFKWRSATAQLNEASKTFIYAAFAEAPFVNSEGVPCNAR